MTIMQFFWIAATYVLGSILICALAGLLIAVQWLDFLDKQKAAAQLPKPPIYRTRRLNGEVHHAEG